MVLKMIQFVRTHELAIVIIALCAALPVSVNAKSNKSLSIYDDTYFMQTYTSDINQEVYDEAYDNKADKMSKAEIKYQFSLAIPLVQMKYGTLMASYTQLSLWQLGNTDASSPFRETNYKPQMFMMHQGKYGIFNNIEYGYRHQSNGKEALTSRSWDMGYIAIERVNTKLDFGLQGWYATNLKDNKDIEDFIPPYEVWMKYHGKAGYFKLKTAYNFSTDKGHVEVGYTYPLSKFAGLYFQVWEGYGESMIDYNHRQTRVGLGLIVESNLNVF
ncbi:phospholipase [Vibrio sp. 03-59-1]|nr:phospholipase [Vibrio sp. 03-59-1]